MVEDSGSSEARTASLGTVFTLNLVQAVFVSWHSLRFYLIKENAAIRMRHSPFLKFFIFLAIPYIITERPWALYNEYFVDDSSLSPIFHLVVGKTWGALLLVSMVFWAWFIYFDIRWNVAMSKGKWIQIIDTNFQETNWFLKHKHTFGSRKWILEHLYIPIAIGVISSDLLNTGPLHPSLLNSLETPFACQQNTKNKKKQTK